MNQNKNSLTGISKMTTTNDLSRPSSNEKKSKKIKIIKTRSNRSSIINLEQGDDNMTNAKRIDKFGNPIIKGSKKFHISFIDISSNQPLEHVVHVVSYKQFNNDPDEDDKVRDAHCGCGCVVM
jgi:hypothetical protein